MSKIISNNDIMNIFKEIDELSLLNLSKEDLSEEIIKRHDKIIISLSFLVYSKTRMYRSFSNYEDLVQEGFIGLVKAVQNFKYHMFPNFFVYSNQWITHYIKKAASRFDIVYNPNKYRVVYSEPSEDEVDATPSPEDLLFVKECRTDINKVLDGFPERESKIVKEIFGLAGLPKTLREIGPNFNLTHERVRQIKNNVLNKLRKNSKICELNK